MKSTRLKEEIPKIIQGELSFSEPKDVSQVPETPKKVEQVKAPMSEGCYLEGFPYPVWVRGRGRR